jgi:hypothetical protein
MLIAILVFLFSHNLWALDTTETFVKKAFDFEMFLQLDKAWVQTTHLGYGVSHLTNPSFAMELDRTSGSLNKKFIFSNIMTIYQGRFDVDLIPSFSTTLSQSFFALDAELTYPFKIFLPYLQLGYSDTDVGTQTSTNISVGIVYEIVKGGEFLAQISHNTPATKKWGYGVGYNHSLSSTWELVSELSYQDETKILVGFIYGLRNIPFLKDFKPLLEKMDNYVPKIDKLLDKNGN